MRREDVENEGTTSNSADGRQAEGHAEHQFDRQPEAPEPPARYEPQTNPIPPINSTPQPSAEFEAANRLVKAAQIMSLVSLVIGGVVLSTASVVAAIVGYRKVTASMQSGQPANDGVWRLLKRSATIAIVMAIGALALNAIALAVIIPSVYEMLQTGDYSSLWNGTNPSSDSSSSFWG